ncbi:Carboxypeptidase regulatory-like domain-containing protein [Granulicella pectinivorans]|uniref:Carboxypeptidase regulatory-like domain-containing protein n=1 Tax=Granulicella pectinivorans TaxID=474950 RepID=A0A1I6MKD5_9BACT|nr:carboxypeptidase regulatory-like domain-containing protein [Granulicella pectinivorans]SFS16186.1 Carboxypeptidase regulatory-like domain-containing protein [Granulicella pectinivorans]
MYRRLSLVLLAILAFHATLSAQETINNASLAGRITDTTGAIIRNASVAVRATSTGIISRTETDAAGRFRFPYLQVGTYELDAHSDGFADSKRSLTLTLGAAFDLPITLTVGASQSVTVNAEAPVLEASRSQIAATISQNEVANLPYNGRNFLDLALLVPGVSPTNTAANQLFAETSAVGGQGISVSSQRNFSNSFIVDGLSANDDAAGLVQTSFGLDVVREMQVVTSGGQAEFGRALGGYINFVSKSGGSKVHGDLYAYLRDKNLNAQNPLSQTLLPYTQVQSGASLSGPIRKDRTFYFGNFEQRQLNQTGIITITAANAAAINTALKSFGYPGQSLNISTTTPTTIYGNPVRASNFFAKLDHKVSDRDQLSARYSLYHVSSVNSRGVGSTSYTSAAAGLEDLDQTVAVSNIFTLNPRTVDETRAQFTNSNLRAPVNDPVGPAVSISGVASFGTLSGSPTGRYDRLYEVVDNISRQAGAHALRVGADFLYNDLTITFPQSIRGSYAFSSLANFQAGRYTTFTQSFGNYVVPQTNPNLGIYAQDEWKASQKLTLNAGLRYDLQFLKTLSTDTNNISPRIGFAYAPFTNRRTVVRGSFGLFYDRIPLRALSNALESSQNTTAINNQTFTTIALSYGQAGAPTFPNIASGYTATTIPSNLRLSLTTMDPHMQNAYSEQGSLEVDQQLTATSNLAISYQHVRGLHLLISVNLNTPTCYATVDPINLCRPNSAYANNKQYASAADSYYDGLSVSYVQRPVRWGSYRVSYTWSKAIDNVGEFFFSSPVNNFNLQEDRGLSDDDQRHRVVFDGTIHSPLTPANHLAGKLTHGFQLGGILQYYSPLPFNITTGQNSIQTTTLRPCLPGYVLTPTAANTCANALPGTMIGRNAGVGFNSFTLNARLSRTFALGERVRLEGIAEAFNALNHRNNQIPNGTFGTGAYPTTPSSTFGQPTAVGDPRSVQLAAKLSF